MHKHLIGHQIRLLIIKQMSTLVRNIETIKHRCVLPEAACDTLIQLQG